MTIYECKFVRIHVVIHILIIVCLFFDLNKHIHVNPLVSLTQSIGPVYDDLAYDEETHFHCLEPTQHSWVPRPKLDQRPIDTVVP